jgi:predicted phosphodiesterase
MDGEVLDRLSQLEERVPVRWVRGNGDREVLAVANGGGISAELNADFAKVLEWAAQRLTRAQGDRLATFEPTVTLEVDGLGTTLFCHASPRSDTESITQVTAEERLTSILAEVEPAVVVCGHTHHQFDLRAAGKRVLNAGSVGMPYQGAAAAFWLALGPDAEFRRTDYDIPAAIEIMRGAGFDDLEETMLRESLLEPIDADTVARYFEDQALSCQSEGTGA